MRIALPAFMILFWGALLGQCPAILSTSTSPPCIPNCQMCAGDKLTINATGGDLVNNSMVDYYASQNPGFDPYLGQGLKIGSAAVTTANPPCRICPQLLGFMIDACGTEAANEFLIMWSGSGFNTSNFNFDFATQNNTGGGANADIGPGGCSIASGNASLVGGCAAIPVGLNFNLPPNSIWIVFTSSNASTSYDFSAICGLSCNIYVSQSTCARTIGAFSNFDASPGSRLQVMTITGCSCSTNASYDVPGMLTGNGDFWAEGNISNNGCAVPGLNPPNYTPAPSVIAAFMYTIPQTWCDKDYEIVGIPNPKPDPVCCNPIYTDRIKVEVRCPKANPTMLEACETNNGQAIFSLEDADANILGGGSGSVEYYKDAAGTQRIFSPFTSGSTTVYARIKDGNCFSNFVAVILKVNLLPIAKSTSQDACDDGSGSASFDLSLLEKIIKNGNNTSKVNFYLDAGKSNPIFSPYYTSSTIIYATIFDGKCESKAVSIVLTVKPKPNATETSITVCPDINGKGIFDLNSLKSKITGSTKDTLVGFYEDDLGLKPVSSPYYSGPDTLYAIVVLGNCKSDPVQVILKLTDLNSVLLISDRTCDDGMGTALFDLRAATRYLQQGDSSIVVSWFDDSLKLLKLIPPVRITGKDTIYAFLRKDSCESHAIPVILEAIARPRASSAMLEICGDTNGEALFHLNDLKFQINNGSGLDVHFAEDSLFIISADSLFTTTGDTLYARTVDGNCNSVPVPVILKVIKSPLFDPIPDLIECDYALLPALLGKNLSAGAGYFDQPMGKGKRWFAGDTITTNQWMFRFDTSGICITQDSFKIDIIKAPHAGVDNRISICEGSILNLNTLLNEADPGGFYIDMDGSGSLRDSFFDSQSHNGKTLRFQYILNPNSFCKGDTAVLFVQVVKQLRPGLDSSVSICEGDTLNVLSILRNADNGGTLKDSSSTGALIGNLWDSRISGPGNYVLHYAVGDGITCPVRQSRIELHVFPQIEILPQADLQNCKYALLPAILGKNTQAGTYYYDQPGGKGTQYHAGDTIWSTTKLYIYGTLTGYCPDEDSFVVRIIPAIIDSFYKRDLCPDISYTIGSTVFNKNNTKGQVLFPGGSVNGCDSILNVDLRFLTDAVGVLNSTLCTGDFVVVNGKRYDENNPAGNEILKGASTFGCDSIVQIQLQFKSKSIGIYNGSICRGEQIIINGKTYSASKLLGTDTLNNASTNGCDSILQVKLSLLDPSKFLLRQQLCFGDTIQIGKRLFNQSNPALLDTLKGAAANGCDSIRDIAFAFYPEASYTLQQTLCENEELVLNGTLYNKFKSTGKEILKGASQFGCDSILYISLNFIPAIRSSYDPIVCEGDSLNIRGVIYNKQHTAGVDTLKGGSARGCDSIIQIQLRFLPTASFKYTSTICEDETVLLNGTLFDKNNLSGTTVLKGKSSNGCDSIINVQFTLNTISKTQFTDTLCAEEQIRINGTVYDKKHNIGIERLQNSNGCDSIITIQLTFNELSVKYPQEITITAGSNKEVKIEPNFTPQQITWSPTAGLSCTDCLNPVIDIDADTDYIVTLTDEYGCSIQITVRVRIIADERIFIPNVFSPNGDNINDIFKLISERSDLQILTFSIYDRWGNEIYNENDKNIQELTGWKGLALNGEKMNPGVYIYYIRVKTSTNEERTFHGDVNLIR